MSTEQQNKDKKVVGLYGEMQLALELHKRGWQVYRAYIDEKFDFVIMKCYCTTCACYTEAYIREEMYRGRKAKCVTNLCEQCQQDTLQMIVRFIQVKTSEGVNINADTGIGIFSFHAKIRYHLADHRMFYVWIAAWVAEEISVDDVVHFYIFKPQDVDRFDNLQLASYQITDNQKTGLRIDKAGRVHNRGQQISGKTANDYRAFEEFHNNFEMFDEIVEEDMP